MEDTKGNQDPNARDSVDDLLPLTLIREEVKLEIAEVLDSVRGRKCLIVDGQLVQLLNHIFGDSVKHFKENGVHYFKDLQCDIADLMNDLARDAPENIIYLVRPHLPNMKDIAQQIRGLTQIGARCQFRIFFAPAQSTVCLHLLEEQISDADLWEKITFKECKLGLIPLESDILSLEMDYVFKECYVDGDLSSLNIVAQSLLKFQSMFGIIPNVKSKGVGARKVLQRMMHKRFEDEDSLERDGGNGFAERSRVDIDTLLILDREVDMVSPLVTPLTYEGLVDEIIGIKNGKIKVEASLLGTDDNELGPAKGESNKKLNPGDIVTLVLNNNDSIFAEIRNLSIERIGSFMQEKAIHIRERYAAFKGNKDASLAEIHEFVKKIPKLTKDFKSLNQHIHIAEHLKKQTDSREFREKWQSERAMLEGEVYLDQIEDLIYSDVDRSMLFSILRLLCLQSLTSGGIRGNKYDVLRRLIVQTYGLQQLYTLGNLERAGLIKRKEALLQVVVETTSLWQLLKKQFRLIDEKMNMMKPDDISYVAAGYAPLLARMVQFLGSGNSGLVASTIEALKLLPGPYLEFTQLRQPEELVDALARNNLDISGNMLGAGSTSSGGALASVVNITSDIGGRINPFRKEFEDLKQNANSFFHESPAKKTMLIYVLGGVTLLEIAAFRFLSNDPNFPYRIVIATTKLINGSNFMHSLQHVY